MQKSDFNRLQQYFNDSSDHCRWTRDRTGGHLTSEFIDRNNKGWNTVWGPKYRKLVKKNKQQRRNAKQQLRQELEEHHNNPPICASCHSAYCDNYESCADENQKLYEDWQWQEQQLQYEENQDYFLRSDYNWE